MASSPALEEVIEQRNDRNYIEVGNRIPKGFFVTSGVGQSDITIHAGSYHLALLDAGIEHLNIMTYSSILPSIAQKINYEPRRIPMGSVLETISAVKSVEGPGQRATAAIMWGWLIDRETESKHGGLVCEYSDSGTEEEAKQSLDQSLQELYTNGYKNRFDLRKVEFHSRSVVATKKYATALVTLGFVTYEVPVLQSPDMRKRKR